MSFFEQYTMAIPIFAPNVYFITRHHLQYNFLRDKNGYPYKNFQLPYHPAYNGSARVRSIDSQIANQTNGYSYVYLDPRNDKDSRAVRHWISMSDYYTFPHVVQFESAEQLVAILQALWEQPSRLHAISAAMRETNRLRLKSLLRYWRQRLLDIAEYSPHHPE